MFESARGPFVLILVGATIVGSMATVWHGVVNPPRGKQVREWLYPASPDQPAVELTQGEEMGRFLLGSTVVMLFPEGPLRFNRGWTAGRGVRLGEVMADGLTAENWQRPGFGICEWPLRRVCDTSQFIFY